MTLGRLWDEEMRNFPGNGSAAALWVVERREETGPLRLVYAWSKAGGCGPGPESGAGGEGPPRLPLGRLLRVLEAGQPGEWESGPPASILPRAGAPAPPYAVSRRAPSPSGLRPPRNRRHRLRAAPLHGEGRPLGAFAVWFEDVPPWGEAVRLWCETFTVRAALFLAGLVARGLPAGAAPIPPPRQLALFTAPAAAVSLPAGTSREEGLPLPRPTFVGGIPGAVGISREIVELGARIPLVARSGVNVLLQGESGTGKELVAAAIHLASVRRRGPLVCQNCAALPVTLFESELFGHRAGAFTGAAADKEGLLEAASGGTFFLDEIGDMPLVLQIKLLRVMQERRVRRIGELESRPVDLRFVAATHKDLQREIAAGRFRLDLFYRLKVVRLVLPPLRQRPEDVASLLSYFLRRQATDAREWRITEGALASLQAYRWPGNARELENEAGRILALFPDLRLIRRAHLSEEILAGTGHAVDPADLGTLRPLDEAGALLERYLIRKAVAAAGGRKAAAARRLGLSRQGLYKKIARYGMTDLVGGMRPDGTGETAGDAARAEA